MFSRPTCPRSFPPPTHPTPTHRPPSLAIYIQDGFAWTKLGSGHYLVFNFPSQFLIIKTVVAPVSVLVEPRASPVNVNEVRPSIITITWCNCKVLPIHQEGLGTYFTLGSHKQQGGAGYLFGTLDPQEQQGGAGDLFYPGSPRTTKGCWGPILPRTNNKGVLGTYSTLDLHEQQKGAGDLFYLGSSRTTKGCWGPILPRVLTNNKGVLGTYSTMGSYKQ